MADKKQEQKLTYEQAMKQLEDIVTKLENNKDLSLEDSIKYFERGTKLAEFCNRELNRAEQRINQINSGDTSQDDDDEPLEDDDDFITEEDFGDDGNSGDSVQADDYDNDLPF